MCWLQVGVKAQFQGSQGQLMFFFGNKGDAALERLIFVVPPAGQFAFQQGAVPPLLEPKKQIQVCYLHLLWQSWSASNNACSD